MRSYRNHLMHTAALAARAVGGKPTFRSSAIFPVFHQAGMMTRIAFLGYWIVKRNLPEITAVFSLRSREGALLYRVSESITEARAYRTELRDMLSALGWDMDEPFTGSLEIEFFSSRDLVFPFPAVVVNYYGPSFSTFVHTAQRVYNDAEDRGVNQETAVPEAGFNLYANADREPFFCFINGFEEVRDGSVSMTFFNKKGETLECALPVARLAPYETMVIYPDRHADLRRFFGGQAGTAKLRFDVTWVFPRIIVGNRQRSLQAVSVTHSYYDCTDSASADDYWQDPAEGWHPASLLIPVTTAGNRFTNVHFYPILSPSEVEIDVELYSAEGRLLDVVRGIRTLSSGHEGSGSFQTLDLKALCLELGLAEADHTIGANLIARPVAGSRLPARLKIGLDYGLAADALPCNICKNMDLFQPALENKTRSFHWGAVAADQADAIVWVVNGAPLNPYRREAEVNLTFYREQDTHIIERKRTLPPNGTLGIRLSEDGELSGFLGGRLGWYTAVSSNPYVKTYYLSESVSGIVGGDHDF